MRTLVYGAGPLGSYYAARLYEAGADVALLARGRRLADLRSHGVVLEDVTSGRREVHDVPVVEALDADDPYELVLVVMRKDQSDAILPTIAANPHVRTVLFLQNNPGGFDAERRVLGADRVMAGFPVMGGQRDDPVMRVLPFGGMPIPIGEADGTVTERTRAVAAHLRRMRGHRVQIRRDMDAWLVSHVPALLPYFGLYASDLDADRFARTRDARLIGVRAQREALRAQRAAGIPVTPAWLYLPAWQPEPLGVALLRALAGTTFFEVGVLAHARVARGEIRVILHEYRERIAVGGVATPVLDRLVAHLDDDDAPPLPDGSREEPLSWTGTGLVVAVALTAGTALAGRRRRARGPDRSTSRWRRARAPGRGARRRG